VSIYGTTLPSNQLEMVLRLESDRMRDLRMTEVALENQKRAVEAEGANAVSSADMAAVTSSQGENVERALLSEAQAFYERFYGPNNAVVVVTGDVDALTASRLVARYFSAIPALREVPTRRPVRRSPEVRHRLTHPTRRTLHLAYAVPPEGSVEDDRLAMLVRLAGTGQTARLRERLIEHAKLASEVGVLLRDTKDRRLFIVNAVPTPGRSMNELELGIRKELAGLAGEPARPAEFERILNAALARHARDLLISEHRAELLGKAELLGGDARLVLTRPATMRKTTPSDLQPLARKYLLSPPQLVVVMEPLPTDPENRQ
jgi:predicted Zn-dependent peptidase